VAIKSKASPCLLSKASLHLIGQSQLTGKYVWQALAYLPAQTWKHLAWVRISKASVAEKPTVSRCCQFCKYLCVIVGSVIAGPAHIESGEQSETKQIRGGKVCTFNWLNAGVPDREVCPEVDPKMGLAV
jgi:hypothetical protein